jgi:hypothetical protein
VAIVSQGTFLAQLVTSLLLLLLLLQVVLL